MACRGDVGEVGLKTGGKLENRGSKAKLVQGDVGILGEGGMSPNERGWL